MEELFNRKKKDCHDLIEGQLKLFDDRKEETKLLLEDLQEKLE
jgi:hypothetical protein